MFSFLISIGNEYLHANFYFQWTVIRKFQNAYLPLGAFIGFQHAGSNSFYSNFYQFLGLWKSEVALYLENSTKYCKMQHRYPKIGAKTYHYYNFMVLWSSFLSKLRIHVNVFVWAVQLWHHSIGNTREISKVLSTGCTERTKLKSLKTTIMH